MHKRLATDLMSLAHEILTLKNKEDIFVLKQKAAELHEKLAVLAFLEAYVSTTPNLESSKEDLTETLENAIIQKEAGVEIGDKKTATKQKEIDEQKVDIKSPAQEIIEQPFDDLEEIIFSKKPKENIDLDPKAEVLSLKSKTASTVDIKTITTPENEELKPKIIQTTLEEELQDTLAVDVAASLFDAPVQKSLNDKLFASINIGLNDRIAFVKHLFNGSQEDYNRVVSQLNTFKTEKEAKKFISKMVKPDYDWSNQEEMETRFIEIIERKFA